MDDTEKRKNGGVSRLRASFAAIIMHIDDSGKRLYGQCGSEVLTRRVSELELVDDALQLR